MKWFSYRMRCINTNYNRTYSNLQRWKRGSRGPSGENFTRGPCGHVQYLFVPAVTVFQSLCQDKKNGSQGLKRVLKLQEMLPAPCLSKMWVYVHMLPVSSCRSVHSAKKTGKKLFLEQFNQWQHLCYSKYHTLPWYSVCTVHMTNTATVTSFLLHLLLVLIQKYDL